MENKSDNNLSPDHLPLLAEAELLLAYAVRQQLKVSKKHIIIYGSWQL
jgi:hypothetical protein